MREESLLRLAISLDDHAPTTVDKYICRLVECILFLSSKNRMSLDYIIRGIEENYGLQFDVLEVENAIRKRAKGSIIYENGYYALTAKRIEALKRKGDMSAYLEEYIQKYSEAKDLTFDISRFKELMIRYLYHCFNSNTQNL